MTSARYKVIEMLALTVFVANAWGVRTAQGQVLQWNEAAQSNIMNRSELVKMGEALPPWKMKQMAWPSSEELRAAAVPVDEKLKDASVVWLAKFIDPKRLPQNLKGHLVAMKGWGLVRDPSQQRRLCDVFITRFRQGPHSVHIQESPGNVVLTVGCEDLPAAGGLDPQGLVVQTSGVFLRQELRPNPQSKLLHVRRDEHADATITKVTWQIESVTVTDEKGNTYRDGVKADQLGTWHVTAETDGRYVRFDIQKFVNAPARLDPCAERF